MMSGPALIAQIEIPVRFCEIDPLSIVWHGHYLKYFEEAREAFGRKYGLGYQEEIWDTWTFTATDSRLR